LRALQERRQPQRGPGETFSLGPYGENFLFKMVHSGVLYIFEQQQGPQNVAGPGVAYPPTPPSQGAWCSGYKSNLL